MTNVWFIYLIACGKQYAGKTNDHFGSRWNNYKSEAKKVESGNKENVKQKFLQSHYLQPYQKSFLKDVDVRLFDKTQGSDPPKTKFYWTRTLKTLHIKSDY